MRKVATPEVLDDRSDALLTLDGGPRSASVMTLEPTTCAVVPGADVREFWPTTPTSPCT